MKKILPWLAAVATVIIWSETFISTKVLLNNGMSPAVIFLLRFVIAYAGIWFFCPHRLFAFNVKDEISFFLMGLIGGSLYFLAENTALKYSTASNVAILVGSAPLVTALLLGIVYKEERPGFRQVAGSIVTFIGMALVVLNGQIALHLNPKGDALAVAASLCWGLYALVLKKVSGRYSIVFLTRKVFAYGILTMLAFFALGGDSFPQLSVLARPLVWGNLVYLGLVASLFCFIAWNWALTKIGVVRTTNLIYGQGFFTMAFAAILLGERITPMAVIGTAILIWGMIIALEK